MATSTIIRELEESKELECTPRWLAPRMILPGGYASATYT